MEPLSDRYLREHTSPLPEALDWIEKQTGIHTNYPQMLSGKVQGSLLKMLVEISGARNVLEIGSFTGYSTACMALGLPEGGHIDALEINDELEDLMRAGWERAGVQDRITLHIGDARKTLGSLAPKVYDLVFIDANKREYPEYFELVFPLLRQGGLLVADDVMLGGKVYADPLPQDAQTRGLLTFNDIMKDDPRVEVVMIPLKDGLSLIRKK
ncbi:MAG: O-methyltransferase [Bacteroidales bacterium]|mgnify:CR=1 FL=1|nr:O-methyltransferase [Candidatus Cryptobacteroides choladohippi]